MSKLNEAIEVVANQAGYWFGEEHPHVRCHNFAATLLGDGPIADLIRDALNEAQK